MRKYIMRHGEANYRQGKVEISQASDLTERGIEVVNDTATHILDTLKATGIQCIHIYSSPFGRCLQTADIVGKKLRSTLDVGPLQVLDDLEEVRNFEWGLFYPLVVGGEVEHEGKKVFVDQKITNPSNLSTVRYFRLDSAHKLSDEARETLPESYIERVSQFEKYSSAISRLHSFLNRNADQKNIGTLVCTHEGPTGDLIEQATGNREAYLQRGKYFAVNKENGLFVPSIVQKDSVSFD